MITTAQLPHHGELHEEKSGITLPTPLDTNRYAIVPALIALHRDMDTDVPRDFLRLQWQEQQTKGLRRSLLGSLQTGAGQTVYS
jgi:hypothetical protein